MCSNLPMPRTVTSSFKRKKQINALAALFNILVKDSTLAWCWILKTHGSIAREQIDLGMVMQTVESVCSTLGLKLGQTWESYLTELPKLPWTSLYLTSLELENYDEGMKERVLYALNYGPCGLKTSSLEIHKDGNTDKVINADPIEVRYRLVHHQARVLSLTRMLNSAAKALICFLLLNELVTIRGIGKLEHMTNNGFFLPAKNLHYFYVTNSLFWRYANVC